MHLPEFKKCYKFESYMKRWNFYYYYYNKENRVKHSIFKKCKKKKISVLRLLS